MTAMDLGLYLSSLYSFVCNRSPKIYELAHALLAKQMNDPALDPSHICISISISHLL